MVSIASARAVLIMQRIQKQLLLLFKKQKKFIKKLLKSKNYCIKIYQYLMKDVSVLSHVQVNTVDVGDSEHFALVFVSVLIVLILRLRFQKI